MKPILAIFRGDLRRLFSNVVSIVITIGLILLPSIFSWYNVLACWNVFDNMGNLKVAVANCDEGYQSDLVPLEVNIGDQVLNSLLEDDEMEWVFTSKEDAIEGARSGKYYAAVVIPESFSKDMMTFFSPDVEHASIEYYSNEKKNVVAPKLTASGADNVAATINSIFVESISETALNIASSLVDYSENGDVADRLSSLSQNIATISERMGQASGVLRSYGGLLSSSRSLLVSSADLLGETGSSAQEVLNSVSEGEESLGSLSDAMTSTTESLASALEESSAGYDGVSQSIDEAYASIDAAANDSSSALETQANSIAAQADSYRDLADALSACQVPSESESALQAFVDQLRTSADTQDQLAESLRVSAQNIRSANEDSQQSHAQVSELAEQAKQSVTDLSQDYRSTIQPQLESLQTQVERSSASLMENANSLSQTAKDIGGSAGTVTSGLLDAQSVLESSADRLDESSEYLADLHIKMDESIASGDWEELKTLLNTDISEFSQSLAEPVQIQRIALYSASNFGSQMAPLYTMLGLWIGSLLLVVTIKVNLSKRALADAGYPKLRQVFLGRFLIFACFSLMQSTSLAVGNVFFLNVQVADVLFYFVCYWISGLVFTFIIYSLVVSFANLGKALAVFLLIIQVSAGGGSYPLPMLPDFVQALSPFLPMTHAINALRETMMGFYCYDFWIEMGILLAFVIPFLILGLVLRKPLIRLLDRYIAKTEESKLIS